MNMTVKPQSYPVSRIIFIVLLFFLPLQTSFAQTHIELMPSLAVSGGYDDNINLDAENERSSYITMVSPSVNFSLLSQNTSISLIYSPSYVSYSDDDEDSILRHLGTLTVGHDLAEHLRFDLTDTVLRSDDPQEETEGVEGTRNTRESYVRNSLNTSLSYTFSQQSVFSPGYRHSLLENSADDVDDGRIHEPFANLNYVFDVHNSIDIDYVFTKAHFWRDDDTLAGDDYYGHSGGLRYIYTFTPYTTVNLGYRLTTRNFEGDDEDYNIHDISTGFDHAFSSDFNVSASVGVFKQKNEMSDDETGYTYSALLIKAFERGSFSIGGDGGWDENYLEADRRGFTKYWSVRTTLSYQILETLSCHAGGFYRANEEESNRNWERIQGDCGLTWTFLRWFLLSLRYSYAERIDDVSADEYNDNRVTLTLTGSRLYRW